VSNLQVAFIKASLMKTKFQIFYNFLTFIFQIFYNFVHINFLQNLSNFHTVLNGTFELEETKLYTIHSTGTFYLLAYFIAGSLNTQLIQSTVERHCLKLACLDISDKSNIFVGHLQNCC